MYGVRVATDGLVSHVPAPGPPREKFRRRPPTSLAERKRRSEWGHRWGGMVGEWWQQQRAREQSSERTKP